MSDLIEQELYMVVTNLMWALGTELGFSTVAVPALPRSALPPAFNTSNFKPNIISFNAAQLFFFNNLAPPFSSPGARLQHHDWFTVGQMLT